MVDRRGPRSRNRNDTNSPPPPSNSSPAIHHFAIDPSCNHQVASRSLSHSPHNDIDLVVSLLVRIGSSSLYVSLLPVTPGRFRRLRNERNSIALSCIIHVAWSKIRLVFFPISFFQTLGDSWLFTEHDRLSSPSDNSTRTRHKAVANLSSSPKRGRWIGGVSHRGSRRRQFGRRGVRLEFCARGTGTRNQELVAPAWLVLSPPLHVLGAIHTWYQMRAYVTFGSGVYCPILGKILGRVASPFRSKIVAYASSLKPVQRVYQKWQLIEEQGRRELDYR